MDKKKAESFIERELDLRNLALGLAAMAPNLILYLFTGSLIWFHGALVTMSLLIVQTRIRPSLALLVTHAITMATLAAIFYLVVPFTYGFALIAALTGFASLWIMRLDKRLLSFGTYNFIPPLYLACEMASVARGPESIVGLWHLLLLWPVSLLSVAIVLRPPLFASPGSNGPAWRRWLGLIPKELDSSKVHEINRAASSRSVSVLLATVLMEWVGIAHGEWGIWSAASVANADSGPAVDKFKNRALGAMTGVAAGILIGPFLPHQPVLYGSVVIGIFLTVTVLKRYVVSFGTRCFFVTIAAFVAAQGIDAGRDRVMNVLVGGVIGLIVTLAYKFAPKCNN